MTDKPFGVNLTILPTINPPPYDEYRRGIVNTARVASNSVSREIVRILDSGGAFPDVQERVAGIRDRRLSDDGDLEAGIWSVGQCQGLIDDIPTAAELVERIVADAERVIVRLSAARAGAV